MWKYILILFGLAGVCTADDLQGYSRIDHKAGTSSKVMLTDPGFEKSGSGWELKPGFAVEKEAGAVQPMLSSMCGTTGRTTRLPQHGSM